MRLWDYRLLNILPDRFIVSQWRECIAIKRQWEKGTLKHRLVSYVMNYDKEVFSNYVRQVVRELEKRNVKFQKKYLDEIIDFCNGDLYIAENYQEHDGRYLKQCLYNLQEKADRGIVSKEDWKRIEERFGEYL